MRAQNLDNGGPFIDSALARTCAVLGIRLTHSQPRRPQGRGKIERFFRTVRDQFLVEWNTPGRTVPDDLVELNTAFAAWVETVYHRRVHSETGQAPLERFLAGGPPAAADPAIVAEAFRWSAWRTVTATATISIQGNVFEVDPALVHRRVEAVFDPFDLTRVEVRYHGRPMGQGIPHTIRRHAHPKARPELAPPSAPTGIDYLKVLSDQHTSELGQRLRYDDLDDPNDPAVAEAPASPADAGQLPGQVDIDTMLTELNQEQEQHDQGGQDQ